MKTSRLAALAAAIAISCALVPADSLAQDDGGEIRRSTKPIPAMGDSAARDGIPADLRADGDAGPSAVKKPAAASGSTTVDIPERIVSSSGVLTCSGKSTLVPKLAILHIPANMKDRVVFQPGSRIHTWAEFHRMNRSWLTTVEVSRGQAEGSEALDEELVNRIGGSGSLVVATFKGDPVPVPRPEDPATTAASGKGRNAISGGKTTVASTKP